MRSKAYDRFRRLVPEPGGMWRIARPAVAQQHRLNAGVIVEQPLLSVRFRNGRKLGTIEEGYASTLSPGDHFYFSGLSLEVEQFKDTDVIVRASSKRARIVTYGGQRMSMSTHLANRVRHMLCDRNDWQRFPDDVRDWLEVQSERSVLPEPHQLLVETFPHEKQYFMVAYSFEGWNAHQSLGMLITRRMESAGLKPMGFVANDYALACYGLEPITDPKALFSPDILEQEFVDWVESSYLLKTAFREVAVIGGLVERHHPGKRKSGRQVSFSTDLIYDVLRRYEPQHLLLRAAWDDARRRMTELGRLVRLVDRAASTMLHVETGRITPMAVPLMVIVGREALPPGAEADETLLTQAEALAEEAMNCRPIHVNDSERPANRRIRTRSTSVTIMEPSSRIKRGLVMKSRFLIGTAVLGIVGLTIGGTAVAQRAGRFRQCSSKRSNSAPSIRPIPIRPGSRAPGDYRFSVEHGGITREYLVHVPEVLSRRADADAGRAARRRRQRRLSGRRFQIWLDHQVGTGRFYRRLPERL